MKHTDNNIRKDANLTDKKVRTDDIDTSVQQQVAIPVVQEELQVGKQEIQKGGVRVETRVVEQPVQQQVSLREEHVNVQRVPANRPVTQQDVAAMRNGSVDLVEKAEVAMVNKEARVVEEVLVSKSATQRTETINDTLRHNEVYVDHIEGQTGASWNKRTGFSAYDNDFRSHFTQGNYAGYRYEDFSPVYQYGYDIATSDRYRGKDWDTIDRDAGLEWDRRNPGTWAKVRDAARHAWMKASRR